MKGWQNGKEKEKKNTEKSCYLNNWEEEMQLIGKATNSRALFFYPNSNQPTH